MPSPGWPTALDPLTPVSDSVRANLRTGTVAVTDGMPADFSYNITARPMPQADDATLSKAHITSLPPVGPARRAAAGDPQPRRRRRAGQAVRLAAGDGHPRLPAQRGVLRRQPRRRAGPQLLPARRAPRRPAADGRLRGAVRRRGRGDAARHPAAEPGGGRLPDPRLVVDGQRRRRARRRHRRVGRGAGGRRRLGARRRHPAAHAHADGATSRAPRRATWPCPIRRRRRSCRRTCRW